MTSGDNVEEFVVFNMLLLVLFFDKVVCSRVGCLEIVSCYFILAFSIMLNFEQYNTLLSVCCFQASDSNVICGLTFVISSALLCIGFKFGLRSLQSLLLGL